MDRLLNKAPKTGGRVGFLVSRLLSSPAVAFVHAPLLVAQTIAGIAIPFATGEFIDALVAGSPAVHPFLKLAALSVASAALAAFLQRFILRHARCIELKLQNEVLESAMDFAPHELSSLTGGELVAKLTRDALRALNGGNNATDTLSVVFGALLGAILVVGQVAILGVAGMFAAKGSIPVGDVVVYQMLFMTAMQSVQSIVTLLPEAATLREAVDSLQEALAHPKARTGGRKSGKIESIEFRHVTFAYPGGKPVIKDFSEVYHAGRAVALVGSNGAGKTTLVKLAIGVYELATDRCPLHWLTKIQRRNTNDT